MVKHWGPIRQWNNLPREVMEVVLWKKPCFCSVSLSSKHTSSLISTADLLFSYLPTFLCHNRFSEELYYMVLSGCASPWFGCVTSALPALSLSFSTELGKKKNLHGYLLGKLLKVFVVCLFVFLNLIHTVGGCNYVPYYTRNIPLMSF